MSAPPLPRWADIVLLPLINLCLALVAAGLVILALGEDPVRAIAVMANGAFFYDGSFGYTLYYTTNFIFTGLCAAIAFHARLFNIGGEGQATLGGLGVALVCLMIPWPHWALALPAAILRHRESMLGFLPWQILLPKTLPKSVS